MKRIHWTVKKRMLIRQELIRRFGNACFFCGRNIGHDWNFHIDHLVPVSQHGLDEINNLLPTCRECNSSKSYATLEYWKEQVLRNIEQLETKIVRYKTIVTQIDRAVLVRSPR